MAAKKKPQKTIQDAYRDALARFGHRPDVTGIDVGYKYTDGQRTETMSIRLHVKEKFPKSALEATDVFPDEIEGFPIDVIQGNYTAGVAVGRLPKQLTERNGSRDSNRGSVSHTETSPPARLA